MQSDLQNILERVKQLYYKYGIKSVTMDDVASELGISKKTLYQYFTDKNELVEKVFNYDFEQRRSILDAVFMDEKNAIEELVDLHHCIHEFLLQHNPATFYDLKKYYPQLYEQHMTNKLNKMYDNVLKNLKKGKLTGLYRNDMNEEIIAKYTVMNTFKLADNETVLNQELSSEFFTEVLIYHIRGIASKKRHEILENYINKIKSYTK